MNKAYLNERHNRPVSISRNWIDNCIYRARKKRATTRVIIRVLESLRCLVTGFYLKRSYLDDTVPLIEFSHAVTHASPWCSARRSGYRRVLIGRIRERFFFFFFSGIVRFLRLTYSIDSGNRESLNNWRGENVRNKSERGIIRW